MSTDDTKPGVETKTKLISPDDVPVQDENRGSKSDAGSLILIHGAPQGKRFPLEKDVILIGRSNETDVQIMENGVSRVHTKLIRNGDHLIVHDMGSLNGTFVNNEKIAECKLQKDDLIGIGVAVLKYLPPGSVEIQYHRRLSDAAFTDPLTGVNNKGYLMEAMENEFKSHKKRSSPLSLIVIDLDLFTDINTDHGHDGGDYVIKEACQIIRDKGVRNTDILGRYGGDEFVVILPDTPTPQAEEIAERIRSHIAGHDFVYDKKPIKLTASCGVATLTPDVTDHISFFKVADRALYKAKGLGRNQLSTS
jgi:diguanylate cyclase (GGDEF)-like protein